MAPFGNIHDYPAPGMGWEGVQAPQHGGAPAPNRHQAKPTLIHAGQVGRQSQL